MSRHPALVRHASLSIGPEDDAVIEAIRAEHGLAFNAAVRYCIRLVGVTLIADAAERRRATKEVEAWLADTKASRRTRVSMVSPRKQVR